MDFRLSQLECGWHGMSSRQITDGGKQPTGQMSLVYLNENVIIGNRMVFNPLQELIRLLDSNIPTKMRVLLLLFVTQNHKFSLYTEIRWR